MERLIVERYNSGMRAREILDLVPFKTRKTIYDVLEKHGVPRRSQGLAAYKRLNAAVFADVDVEERAYWLGMLLADGYVSDTRRDAEAQVGLQLTDEEHVERFRSFIGSPNPVLRIPARKDSHKDMYRVVVNSDRLARDLAKFGVVPRKSKSTYLPILRPELMPHLLRGLCDGDGTISRRSDGCVLIGYCGSQRLIAELRIWFICALGVADNRIHHMSGADVIQWTASADVRAIARYLYAKATICLDRKRDLVRELL